MSARSDRSGGQVLKQESRGPNADTVVYGVDGADQAARIAWLGLTHYHGRVYHHGKVACAAVCLGAPIVITTSTTVPGGDMYTSRETPPPALRFRDALIQDRVCVHVDHVLRW